MTFLERFSEDVFSTVFHVCLRNVCFTCVGRPFFYVFSGDSHTSPGVFCYVLLCCRLETETHDAKLINNNSSVLLLQLFTFFVSREPLFSVSHQRYVCVVSPIVHSFLLRFARAICLHLLGTYQQQKQHT